MNNQQLTKLMELADRIKPLQSNVFADMDRAKSVAISQGKTIIDLSLGSSDLAAPDHVIKTIEKELHNPSTHAYLLHGETQKFRQVVAQWYENRFGIAVNPETEVLQLIGCQEGTAHLPLAVLNPGDIALLLDPGYPSHAGGVYLAGGQIYTMPLLAENNYLPVFKDIPNSVLTKAKMMVLSYPHNPTTGVANLPFFEDAVNFCKTHNIVLVHDFPYMDIYFDNNKPPSIFQADTKKQVSIEFLTFSKSYNMGGFRIGFAIGNEQLIQALKQVKAVIDFNQYRGILTGAISALTGDQECVKNTVNIYRERRDYLVNSLAKIGWQIFPPKATLYVWAKLPEKWANNSGEFCTQLVAKTGVALSAGAGFGKLGEGYVRFALVREPDILQEAVAKIASFEL
jgi:aspartate/methionine/tyrosine aminotransferase